MRQSSPAGNVWKSCTGSEKKKSMWLVYSFFHLLVAGSYIKFKGQILHVLMQVVFIHREFLCEPLELLILREAILSLISKVFHSWNIFGSGTGWKILFSHGKNGETKWKVLAWCLRTGIMALRVPGIKCPTWTCSWEWWNWKSESAQINVHNLWCGYREQDNKDC